MIANVEAAVDSLAPEVLSRYGAKIAPFILIQREFIRKAKQNLPPIQDIVKEGIVIAGLSVKGLLNAK